MSRLARAKAALQDDAGFSLAELGVYSVLSVVILLICSTIFIGSTTTRAQVVNLTTATSVGQLIANSVAEGAHNAAGAPGSSGDQRLGVKAEEMTAEGQLLRARVAVGASDGTVIWQCQAWFYSTTTKAIYVATNPTTMVVDPVSFSIINSIHTASAGTDHWTLLGDGIELYDPDQPEAHPQVFGSDGTTGGLAQVVLYFSVTKNDTTLALIPTTVVNRQIEATGTGPTECY